MDYSTSYISDDSRAIQRIATGRRRMDVVAARLHRGRENTQQTQLVVDDENVSGAQGA